MSNVDEDTRYDIHENECHAITMHASVVNRDEAFSKKKFFCILMIAVTVILLIIAVFISIVFAFVEISNLKNISFGQSDELAKLNNKCEANGRMLNVSMLKLNQLRQDYVGEQNPGIDQEFRELRFASKISCSFMCCYSPVCSFPSIRPLLDQVLQWLCCACIL